MTNNTQKIRTRTSKLFRVFILPLMLLVVFASLYTYNTHAVIENIIEIDPLKIDIWIPNEEVSKIPNATLYITAKQGNLTRISINATDLYEEKNRQLWIPSEIISFNKNHFNLTEGNSTSVEVSFTFRSNPEPGSYVGKIIIRGENGGKVEVPITIKLRVHGWRPFFAVVLGVGASLGISIARWRFEQQDSARLAIDSADLAIYQAEEEGRKDILYVRAVDKQTEYQKDFETGDFKKAEEKAIKAKSMAEKAKQATTATPKTTTVTPKTEAEIKTEAVEMLQKTGQVWEQTVAKIVKDNRKIVDSIYSAQPQLNRIDYKGERILGRIKETVNSKSFWIYFTFTITITVVMLQAWEAFYPRIIDFGASYIDYVTAFLYGFSGQTFLNAFADIGKRWL